MSHSQILSYSVLVKTKANDSLENARDMEAGMVVELRGVARDENETKTRMEIGCNVSQYDNISSSHLAHFSYIRFLYQEFYCICFLDVEDTA